MLAGSARFEGDLNEKGLKPLPPADSQYIPRFEGDLNEKGLKRAHVAYAASDSVLKET